MNTLPSFRDLVRQSWSIYTSRFKRLLLLIVLTFMVSLLGVIGSVPAIMGITFALGKGGMAGIGTMTASIVWAVAMLVTMILVSVALQIAMIFGISEEGENVSTQELVRKSLPFVLPYLWVSILTGLAVLAGFVMLIIPGIVFSLWFWMSTFLVIFENERGIESMRKSRGYMKGLMKPVLWRFLGLILLVVLVSIAAGIVSSILHLDQDNNIISVIFNSILSPFFVAYSYLLYRAVRRMNSEPEVVAEPEPKPEPEKPAIASPVDSGKPSDQPAS